MKRETAGAVLSAVFVDYDNIYMSLRRKNEDAAKRFAKDAAVWLKAIETGALISPTNSVLGDSPRRIVMNRCYGNPVPRRNSHDNSTDMTSFPFIRHHFLRAGFEVVDCPPLTAQLKNSSDIRMVMDLRDYLVHDTYFEEFIILSGDADFTPVLHRLRQHARRTVIYANEHTAQPYTAICDGEIREVDLVGLLTSLSEAVPPSITANTSEARLIPVQERSVAPQAQLQPQPQMTIAELKAEILAEIVATVRTSPTPLPLEALADRALRSIGHERTIGTNWAGAGSFRELLRQGLPTDVRMSDAPPFVVFDVRRHGKPTSPELQRTARSAAPPRGHDDPWGSVASAGQGGYSAAAPAQNGDRGNPPGNHAEVQGQAAPAVRGAVVPTVAPTMPQAHGRDAHDRQTSAQPVVNRGIVAQSGGGSGQYGSQNVAVEQPSRAQQMVQRIYEASKAPPFAPAEYRALFEIISQEINENSIAGKQTITNIVGRAAQVGLELKWDDARFVYDVVSEPDPWFELGASANLFGGRFRNYVVQRCRDAGVALTAKDLDMIDAWFAAGSSAGVGPSAAPQPGGSPQAESVSSSEQQAREIARWRTQDPLGASAATPASDVMAARGELEDDFPRIVRTRRG